MNSKHRSIVTSAIAGLSLLGTATSAFAHPPRWSNAPVYRGDDYDRAGDRDERYARYEYARVISVEPIVSRVRIDSPQRDCWYEEQEVYPQRGIDNVTAGPTVLGALIGGVVGHQFGNGRGRDAATIAGTVIGASIGHDSAVRAGGGETRNVRRCETRYEPAYEEHVDAYRVTYVHDGRAYCTRMAYDPGERVRIQVALAE